MLFRIYFHHIKKQFRFCRLFVLLVKGQTIWTHLCAIACRKRNSKSFQSLEKIKHSRAHILWRGKHRQSMLTFRPSITLTISIAAWQSRFWRGCFVLPERRSSCQEHPISNLPPSPPKDSTWRPTNYEKEWNEECNEDEPHACTDTASWIPERE